MGGSDPSRNDNSCAFETGVEYKEIKVRYVDNEKPDKTENYELYSIDHEEQLARLSDYFGMNKCSRKT